MNRSGRILAAAVSLAAVASLAVTACSAPAHPAAEQATEQAAVQNWLAKTNAMWTSNDFAALDEITTAEMRTIYLAEERQASLPSNASRQAFQLTGLSIAIPCQAGHYASAAGLRAKNWPDGNEVATPRPAVVHHETDTFITTYTAIDPPRSAGAPLTLDGFFGWPLAAVAS